MDDEALFASFVCIRERPLVLFCFDGAPRHGSFEVRWAEAQKATRMLGCEALALRETPQTIEDRLAAFDADHVWAPLAEEGGNEEHNLVGEAAERLWGDRVSYYSTYTNAGPSTEGWPIPAEPVWIEVKRRAMGCYVSQIRNRCTAPHFAREDLTEYELVPAAVFK